MGAKDAGPGFRFRILKSDVIRFVADMHGLRDAQPKFV